MNRAGMRGKREIFIIFVEFSNLHRMKGENCDFLATWTRDLNSLYANTGKRLRKGKIICFVLVKTTAILINTRLNLVVVF